MVIEIVLTAVIAIGLIIILRIDVAMHRAADAMERIATALESPLPLQLRKPGKAGAAAQATSRPVPEEVAAAIAAARLASSRRARGELAKARSEVKDAESMNLAYEAAGLEDERNKTAKVEADRGGEA